MSARHGLPTEAQLAALRRATEAQRAQTHCRKTGQPLVNFKTGRACYQCRATNQRAYRLRVKARKARVAAGAIRAHVVACISRSGSSN